MSPRRPPRICNRCRRTVTGPCPTCEKPWQREPQSWTGGSTRRWRKLRQQRLSDEPFCRACKQRGRLVPAHEVDHVLSIANGGERYDYDNTQSLCTDCHKDKTQKESQQWR